MTMQNHENKIHILFICHGNICRSPMAEMVMKEMVRQKGLEGKFEISSMAATTEEMGHDIYPPAKRALDEYFQGKRKTFDIPLRTHGTPFQEKVWAALRAIPYGEVRSYKEVSEAIGHPKAYRAVGMANNANPIFIIVPCHRVIGSDGSLTGYGGGLPMKKALLSLEKKHRIS
jgi:methylated-DNA-[protein]-cysteine S-methyltransferase